MTANPGKDFQKKFTGNILFYRETKSRRSPIFLQRNIRKFLQYHSLQAGKSTTAPPTTKITESRPGPDAPRMGSAISTRRSWTVKEIQASLAKCVPDEPILRIDVTGIKDRKARSRHSYQGRESPAKRLKRTHVRAQCLLTVWLTDHVTGGQPIYLVQQSKPCDIQATTKESGERTATISLESPFFVKHHQLRTEDFDWSHPDSTQHLEMQLVLVPDNPSDPWPPFHLSSPPPIATQKTENGALIRFPMLLGHWAKLPRLPASPSESAFDMYAYQDRKRYKTNLALVVEAFWSIYTSPLEVHNGLIRKAPSPSPPLIKVESEPQVRSTVSVRWIFQGSWDSIEDLEFEGYFCPLCNRCPFSTADMYRFHLITHHDLFNFEISIRADAVRERKQRVSVEVYVSVADTFRAKSSNHVKDDREMEWLRPSVPFDLQAFLKGDGAWPGNESKRQTNTAGATRNRPGASGSDLPKAERFIRRRKADDVPNLPFPNQRKYKVPPAPNGITFFRLTVKRPLVEGEMISESDEEIDEGWLLQRHNDTIRSYTDMMPSEKKFILRYDRHMLKENLSSNLHFREALIRFCRKNHAWLRQKDMNIEFHKNCAKLIMEGFISSRQVRDCVEIIGKGGSNGLERKYERAGFHSQETTSTSSIPDDDETRRQRYGGCTCGSNLFTSHDIIRCSNLDCKAPEYHLQCMRLSNRPALWLCSACESMSSPLMHSLAGSPSSAFSPYHATDTNRDAVSFQTPNGEDLSDPEQWNDHPDPMSWERSSPPRDADPEYNADEGYEDYTTEDDYETPPAGDSIHILDD